MRSDGEKGYPPFFFYATRSWAISTFVALLVITAGGGLYFWYSRFGSDPAPDGIAGLGYALAGTLFLVLAAVLYSIRRRSRKRAMGELNSALHWHIGFGVMGLALLCMHSFGNFNPRSGTFALYGMIALVISGFVGRILDRVIPRLITIEMRKAVTAQGEDRIEHLSQKLQAIAVHNTQELHPFKTNTSGNNVQGVPWSSPSTSVVPFQGRQAGQDKEQTALPALTSWDLAYISLEETPQELERNAARYRFVPDKKSALSRPEALFPGAQDHMAELHYVQHALQREQMYRYIIRYWRIFHVCLVLLTIGLTLWHLEYAAQLWLPAFLHR